MYATTGAQSSFFSINSKRRDSRMSARAGTNCGALPRTRTGLRVETTCCCTSRRYNHAWPYVCVCVLLFEHMDYALLEGTNWRKKNARHAKYSTHRVAKHRHSVSDAINARLRLL
ncbi:unnamed protein product [Trichogramma brassicae]|uniref:Uncharacterized protein n=1 Tax=Trichogramma brassicae TaxID=86971 RepID=A0A6H5I1T0_9HYME|nr:unnamed protein product [Trichogramma brassicae]